jgi:hypothetical protein
MSTSTAHGAGRLSKEEIAELWRKERERIGRLSPKEIESGLALIAQLRRSQAKLLAERRGVPFPPGWKDLNDSRDERSRELGG